MQRVLDSATCVYDVSDDDGASDAERRSKGEVCAALIAGAVCAFHAAEDVDATEVDIAQYATTRPELRAHLARIYAWLDEMRDQMLSLKPTGEGDEDAAELLLFAARCADAHAQPLADALGFVVPDPESGACTLCGEPAGDVDARTRLALCETHAAVMHRVEEVACYRRTVLGALLAIARKTEPADNVSLVRALEPRAEQAWDAFLALSRRLGVPPPFR